MLKKLVTGGLTAGALAIPFAGMAWADPPPAPNPPVPPNVNGQAPVNPAGPVSPGAPVVPGSNNAQGNNPQGPTCITSASLPTEGPPGTVWRDVATIHPTDAADLGLPAGQTMKVFCTKTALQNLQPQPAGFENPGQPQPQNPAQGPQNQQPGAPYLPWLNPQNAAPGQQ